MDALKDKIQRSRQVFEQEYFLKDLGLAYDYRTSLEHKHRFDHLPTTEEIAQRIPNPCGWGTGMEDSVINGGIALDMYLDADDECWARKIFRGLKRCGTISGIPGFVARSISPRDGKSFYPESSRDQYTHYVYSLWRYFQSPLSTPKEKREITTLLVDVARFCEKYITAENDWTLPRADFREPRSSVCKLWHVKAHETARLPMFYAGAYSVSGDSHWLDCALQYAQQAAEESMKLESRSYHAFALMQMLCSCRLLYEVLPVANLKARFAEVMKRLDLYLDFNACRAADDNYRVDLTASKEDWRSTSLCTVIPGCRHVIPKSNDAYDLAKRVIREIGELVLCSLLKPKPMINPLRRQVYRFIMDQFTPENYASFGGLYVTAAWYKARKLGIEL